MPSRRHFCHSGNPSVAYSDPYVIRPMDHIRANQRLIRRMEGQDLSSNEEISAGGVDDVGCIGQKARHARLLLGSIKPFDILR